MTHIGTFELFECDYCRLSLHVSSGLPDGWVWVKTGGPVKHACDTCSVILRAQAWSAWLARAEADRPAEDTDEQRQPVVHYDPIADRPKLVLKPQAKQIRKKTPVPDECDTAVSVTRNFSPEIGIAARTEDPDEWVIQDRGAPRKGVDELRWSDWPEDIWVTAIVDWPKHKKHGYLSPDHDCILSVRCRRRGLPKVEQVKTDAGHDWSYHEKQKPQPQKRMLRLWVDSDCNIHAGLKGDRDLELLYDSETKQFYTEEPS